MSQKEAFNAWWEENHEIVSHPENTRVNRKFTAYKAWEAGIQFIISAIDNPQTLEILTPMLKESCPEIFYGRLERLPKKYGFANGDIRPIEPASSMQDDSPRMMAIGQNGNNGEHYE